MMKYFKVSLVLALIAMVCSAIIAGINLATSPIIAKNKEQTEEQTIKKIFKDYDKELSEDIPVENEAISKKILARDKDGNALGYVYNVSGKNAYGTIALMVAIKDELVYQVEFITNEQSFASTVESHMRSSYPSSEKSSVEIGFAPEVSAKVQPLDLEDVEGVDVNCGATYGATLIKELVKVAYADYIQSN